VEGTGAGIRYTCGVPPYTAAHRTRGNRAPRAPQPAPQPRSRGAPAVRTRGAGPGPHIPHAAARRDPGPEPPLPQELSDEASTPRSGHRSGRGAAAERTRLTRRRRIQTSAAPALSPRSSGRAGAAREKRPARSARPAGQVLTGGGREQRRRVEADARPISWAAGAPPGRRDFASAPEPARRGARGRPRPRTQEAQDRSEDRAACRRPPSSMRELLVSPGRQGGPAGKGALRRANG